MRRIRWLMIAACCLPVTHAAVDADGFVRIVPDEIVYAADNPGGPEIALLAGDPAEEGFYLLRARFRPGVTSSPHYHSTERHVTVIQGTWYTGTDDSYDMDKAVPLGPGSYMMHPAGAIHYDGAKDEEVIVEIKGIGPATTVRLPQ